MGIESVSRRVVKTIVATSLFALVAAPAATQQNQQVFPPIARYTVDAGTMSGMAAMAGGSMSAMAMMRGGPPSAAHELYLRIGSTRSPTGAPTAGHFMPAGAQLGESVDLVTPTPRPSEEHRPEGELPTGRLLIYWGCGPHAGAGQPVVIDFAKVARGQIPPGLYMNAMHVPGEWEITQANSTTYGEWPNARDNKAVRPGSSLLGAHRIASSYAPEINFTLAQDFMPALNARTAEQPGGSIMLDWNGLAPATGYYAWAFSAKSRGRGQPQELVWWASSAQQAFGGPLWTWLSPAAVRQLVQQRTVMPPSQTRCEIPAEFRQSAGTDPIMGSVYAYGPEQHFAYPPRPANVREPWRPDWTARVRFRSNTMFMVGMDMPGMSGGAGADASANGEGEQQQQPRKPRCRGLSGIAQRAAGLCE